ncbi:hypothetical protein LTR10_002702 [Elasticomyces elasticus]|nr:hypothetical protein LTR10_002702 [Elasticomyces elasticus]KAK4967957.1 hypothetical protein LTR42_010285 [Elasticomyces elasticus]
MADTTSLVDSVLDEAELKHFVKAKGDEASAKFDEETRELSEQCEQHRTTLARSHEAQTNAQSKVAERQNDADKAEEAVSDRQAKLDWAIAEKAKADAAVVNAERDGSVVHSDVAGDQERLDCITRKLATRTAEVNAIKVAVARRATIEFYHKVLWLGDETGLVLYAPVEQFTSKPGTGVIVEQHRVGSSEQQSAKYITTTDHDDQEEQGPFGGKGFNTLGGSITMMADGTVYHDATERVRLPTSPSLARPGVGGLLLVSAIDRPAASKPVPPKRKPWRPTERSEKEYAAAQRKYEAELAVWMQNNAANESGAAKKRKTVKKLENAA